MSKMDLQKLLLLYSAKHGSDHYAFVPYRYGAYSFHCQSDLNLLVRRGWIAEEDERLALKVRIADMPWARQSGERRRVRHWLPLMRGDKLVAESYRLYPYYAIRSEIKSRLLSAEELQRVKAQQPTRHSSEPCVFTLGYEGMAFEAYLNQLIKNDVRALCDVRKNPFSRKFGFSGSMLERVLGKLDIAYVHQPELGIASDRRRDLQSPGVRQALLATYREELPDMAADLRDLAETVTQHRRVALTCFEMDSTQCHRHSIADFLSAQHGFKVTHL